MVLHTNLLQSYSQSVQYSPKNFPPFKMTDDSFEEILPNVPDSSTVPTSIADGSWCDLKWLSHLQSSVASFCRSICLQYLQTLMEAPETPLHRIRWLSRWNEKRVESNITKKQLSKKSIRNERREKREKKISGISLQPTNFYLSSSKTFPKKRSTVRTSE